jgi:hypothetical protein
MTGYKERIYVLHLDRRVLAGRMGLTYSTFNNKLLEFGRFTPEQDAALRKILDEAEQAQVHQAEVNTDKNLFFFQK